MPTEINTIWITVAQYIALSSMILAWIAYRQYHSPKDTPRFRIEKVVLADESTFYYCMRRWPLNIWRDFQVEKGVKGYISLRDAERGMEHYFNRLGFRPAAETTVEKEYG